MTKILKNVRSQSYWENLSDQELLDIDLITEDPEGLENLVYEIPAGDEDTFVEFKYDLRGSGREEFACVHGHHRHLAGFVMRKGTARFLVGWQCAKTIYGAIFDEYEADFSAAENRKRILLQFRDLTRIISPLLSWLDQVFSSNIFDLYNSVREQIAEHLRWIWDNAPRIAQVEAFQRQGTISVEIFSADKDPQNEFSRIVNSVSALAASIIGKQEIDESKIKMTRKVLENAVRQIEKILNDLQEIENFFQPANLELLCNYANKHDNPNKRRYEAGLLSITCFRSRKSKISVQLPKNYRLPNRAVLDATKEALRTV
jgi:hypothetical protein